MNKKKILIIDDEKDFTEIVKLNLEKTGKYEVLIENNGSRGLAAAKKFKPALILLDILMPGKDGFGVLKMLKEDLNTISIPVIMLTAVMSDEAKIKSASLYNESYIEKPVSVDTLEREIEKVFKLRRG